MVEAILLNTKLRASRRETVMRWLAMGVATTAPNLRPQRLHEVALALADAIKREGLSGKDAEDCLNRHLTVIRTFATQIAATLDAQRRAHAA